jgi:glycosyltransferase involved in cell wall biosynthesis
MSITSNSDEQKLLAIRQELQRMSAKQPKCPRITPIIPIIKNPISIIIYAYKAENFIEECLDSIERQTYFNNYDNYEIIIGIDDCKNTYVKLRSIKEKYKNLRIYQMSKHKGIFVTYNTLLDLIHYDYVLPFKGEDIMKPEMIEEIMKHTKDYDIVKFNYQDFDDEIINTVENKFWLNSATYLFNKYVIELVGGYQNWTYAADIELLERVSNFIKIIDVKKILFYKRQKDEDFNIEKNKKIRKTYENNIKKYNIKENIKIEKVIDKQQSYENKIYTEEIINKKPISILITAYKAENFIEECLDSIEKQTYFINNNNYEILLGIDNCEDTLKIIKLIQYKYRNLHIYMMSKNNGPYITLNTLLDLIQYENIVVFGADDIMKPEMIEKIMCHYEKYDLIRFGFDDFTNNISKAIKNNYFKAFGAIFYKKRVIELSGGYQPWRCSGDFELLKRIESYVKIKEINESLFYRRDHPNSLTNKEDTSLISDLRKTYNAQIKNYKHKINVKIEDIKIDKITSEYSLILEENVNIKTQNKLNYKNLTPIIINNDNNYPLVTIIIAYNEDRGYLNAAIESIKNQTYKNIELILSCSPNGVSYNINRAFKISKGTYIKYVDEDDILTPISIEDSVNTLLSGDYDLIHGIALNFFENGKTTTYIPPIASPTLKQLLQENTIDGGSLMYNRRVFDKYGLFDQNLWTGEEYDFNLKILSKGGRVGYCNKILYNYRRHSKQKSLGNLDTEYQKKRIIVIQQIKDRYFPFKDTLPIQPHYNIFAAIPVYGRHDLLPHTIKRLLTKCGVSKVYCMGDNAIDRSICESAGAEWINHPNSPLGRKWNIGIQTAINSRIEYDGFLFVGSSDWISEDWINTYAPYLSFYDLIGTTNCYFLDIDINFQKKLIHWSGYSDYNQPQRKGEAIGIGRLYSMRSLKKLKGKLFPEDLNTGMDLYSKKNILSINGKVRSFVAENLKTISISTNKWVNKHNFEEEMKDPSSSKINNVDEWLIKYFPEAFKVFSRKIDQVYLSKSVESFRKELKEKYKLNNYYSKEKPVFIFGMYRKEDYDFAIEHTERKVIFWCGSDSIYIKPEINKIKNALYLAGSKFVSDDLKKANIPHLFVPVTTANFNLPVCPRGDSIYFYYNVDSEKFYGMQYLNEIKQKTRLNIILATHTTYSYEELINVYKQCFIGLRLTEHDGIPTTGCELGLMGRKIIHNGNQPNCLNYKNIDDIIKSINEEYLHRHEDNKYIAQEMRKYLDVDDFWLYV